MTSSDKTTTVPISKLNELLAKIAATPSSQIEKKEVAVGLDKLRSLIATHKPTDVDLTNLSITTENIDHDETTDILKEAISGMEQNILSETSFKEETLQSQDAIAIQSYETDGNQSAIVHISNPQTTEQTRVGVARTVTLNSKQADFRDKVLEGNDIILIGAAGTGKTTSMRQTTRALIDSGKLLHLHEGTKVLEAGAYGVAICSFTRKAVNNIRHAVVDELKKNTITLHKLLEFQPVFHEILDDATGKPKKTMRFEPARNATNPLPRELNVIAFEEASMIAVDLYEMLQEAMPHPHQEIFLGDIQQLPPTFGLAILGFKMLELPIIELTEVYRQARDNPILDVAWKLLEGDPTVFSGKLERDLDHPDKKRVKCPALDALSRKQFSEENGEVIGEVKFQIWQKPLDDVQGVIIASTQFNHWADTGYYNPERDIILCPYNKAFGTIEINNRISQHLGAKRGATVYEIIAGFEKKYLAVGDRVLYDKEDAVIVNISHNADYTGLVPQPASKNLDRWGAYHEKLSEAELLEHEHHLEENEVDIDLSAIMQSMAEEVEDRVKVASHGITIRYTSTDEEQVLTSAGEINNLLGGYAITVHKFQGSEEERVFIVLHNSHAKMVSRELLYTAVTRAKKFLHIICEPKSFYNGIISQRIKGNTLAEKALKFTGARDEREALKKQKELEEHKRQQVEMEATADKWDRMKSEVLAKEQREAEKASALEALVTSSKPVSIAPNWKWDMAAGKMVEVVPPNPAYAVINNARILADVISDPAEELPEPVPYSKSIEPTSPIMSKLAMLKQQLAMKESK